MRSVALKRETDPIETEAVTQYYLWLAFTTSLDFQRDPRFLCVKHYCQAAGLL